MPGAIRRSLTLGAGFLSAIGMFSQSFHREEAIREQQTYLLDTADIVRDA